jgi:hypothetical protein
MTSQAVKTWEKTCSLLEKATAASGELPLGYTDDFVKLCSSVLKQSSAAFLNKLLLSQVGSWKPTWFMANLCA